MQNRKKHHKPPNKVHKKNEKYEVIIVGAGIGGLTAAAKASQAGKKVLVIESRDKDNYAIRPQLIHLDQTSKEIIKMLYHNGPKLNRKHRQIYKKLIYGPERDFYNIKDIQKLLMKLTKPEFCSVAFESEVTDINMKDGYVRISSRNKEFAENKTSFEYLIISDGSQQKTVSLLNPKIQYHSLEERPEKNHAIAYLTVQRKDGRDLSQDDIIKITANKQVILLDNERMGFVYGERGSIENNENEKMKFSALMQVSDEQFEDFESNREKGIQYLKHCAASVFDEKEYTVSMTQSTNPLHAKNKDQLKYATFKLKYMKANQAGFSTDKSTVMLVGETESSSEFYYGDGANKAIRNGCNAVLVVSGKKDLADYQRCCDDDSALASLATKRTQPTNEHFKEYQRKHYVVPPFEYVQPLEVKPDQQPLIMHEANLPKLTGQHATLFSSNDVKTAANDKTLKTNAKNDPNNKKLLGCCPIS